MAKKLLVLLLIFVFIGATGVTSLAASLIEIWNPETVVSTTTQSDYILSGSTCSGMAVNVYYLDRSSGEYRLLYVSGRAASQVIGASGMFAQRVYLREGKNTLLVRADSGDSTQIVKLNINLVVGSVWDNIKKSPLDVQKGLRNIFN